MEDDMNEKPAQGVDRSAQDFIESLMRVMGIAPPPRYVHTRQDGTITALEGSTKDLAKRENLFLYVLGALVAMGKVEKKDVAEAMFTLLRIANQPAALDFAAGAIEIAGNEFAEAAAEQLVAIFVADLEDGQQRTPCECSACTVIRALAAEVPRLRDADVPRIGPLGPLNSRNPVYALSYEISRWLQLNHPDAVGAAEMGGILETLSLALYNPELRPQLRLTDADLAMFVELRRDAEGWFRAGEGGQLNYVPDNPGPSADEVTAPQN